MPRFHSELIARAKFRRCEVRGEPVGMIVALHGIAV
jgi:hypothetical protein